MSKGPFEFGFGGQLTGSEVGPVAADQVQLAAAARGETVVRYAAASAAEARAAYDVRHGRVAPALGHTGAGEVVPDEVQQYLPQ